MWSNIVGIRDNILLPSFYFLNAFVKLLGKVFFEKLQEFLIENIESVASQLALRNLSKAFFKIFLERHLLFFLHAELRRLGAALHRERCQRHMVHDLFVFCVKKAVFT